MTKDTKVKNSNPDFIEIDFSDSGLEHHLINSIDSKYEVLKLTTREVALLIGKYRSRLRDLDEFIASLSFNDYLEILKNTMRNGVYAQYSQKKSSGIKVNSTPAKISD